MRRKPPRRSESTPPSAPQSQPPQSALSGELVYALVRRRSLRAQALQQYDAPAEQRQPVPIDPRLMLKPL